MIILFGNGTGLRLAGLGLVHSALAKRNRNPSLTSDSPGRKMACRSSTVSNACIRKSPVGLHMADGHRCWTESVDRSKYLHDNSVHRGTGLRPNPLEYPCRSKFCKASPVGRKYSHSLANIESRRAELERPPLSEDAQGHPHKRQQPDVLNAGQRPSSHLCTCSPLSSPLSPLQRQLPWLRTQRQV